MGSFALFLEFRCVDILGEDGRQVILVVDIDDYLGVVFIQAIRGHQRQFVLPGTQHTTKQSETTMSKSTVSTSARNEKNQLQADTFESSVN